MIFNPLKGLNKELMSLLEEREQSGIIQDSILVDVEDFTRWRSLMICIVYALFTYGFKASLIVILAIVF